MRCIILSALGLTLDDIPDVEREGQRPVAPDPHPAQGMRSGFQFAWAPDDEELLGPERCVAVFTDGFTLPLYTWELSQQRDRGVGMYASDTGLMLPPRGPGSQHIELTVEAETFEAVARWNRAARELATVLVTLTDSQVVVRGAFKVTSSPGSVDAGRVCLDCVGGLTKHRRSRVRKAAEVSRALNIGGMGR